MTDNEKSAAEDKSALQKLISDELARESSSDEPTGSCTLNVGLAGEHCFEGLTKKSCDKVASNLSAVASWTEGGKCPK